jgi:hypothetical protein
LYLFGHLSKEFHHLGQVILNNKQKQPDTFIKRKKENLIEKNIANVLSDYIKKMVQIFSMNTSSSVKPSEALGAKSVSPVASSNTKHAKDHISAEKEYPDPIITSGARYSLIYISSINSSFA